MLRHRRRHRLSAEGHAPDIDGYQRLIDRLLLAEIGIDRYFTYIVTRVVKASFQPPARLAGR